MEHSLQAPSRYAGLSVGAKLWLGLVLLIFGMVGLVLDTSARSRAVTAQSEAVLAQKSEKLQLATRWAGLVETNVTRVQASFIASSPTLDATFGDLIPQTVREVTAVQRRLEALPLSPQDQEWMQRIAQGRQAVLDSLARARQLREQGQPDAAIQEITQTFNPLVGPYLNSLREFAELQSSQLQESQAGFAVQRDLNMARASAMLGVLILLILAGAWLLIRSIRTPLNEVMAFAQQMADGNLGVSLSIKRQDEFGQMSRTLNAMRKQIAQVVADVRHGTDGITAVAQEIAAGNQNLSERTEQSASNLEQTAASMESMSEGIGHSAASARTASELATAAGQSAQQGREVVGSVVHTMSEIQQASKKISEIISVIDGIAFQTNILALNAAVEAARAGEAGRGFAVVASEVRSLAGRSAEAAKEIKVLINNSVDRVGAGVGLVNQAGESIQAIVEQVERVRDVVAEISSASAEQAEGVAQINAAVSQLDQMTQQNAALVEQSAAAAAAMSEQARALSEVVCRFRLE